MVALWVVLAVAVVVLAVVVQRRLHAKRIAALLAVATAAGLRFAEHDVLSTADLPFSLFSEGKKQGVDWTMWGTGRQGSPLRVCDFWYYTESRDANGNRHRTYHRFTCVVTDLGRQWPHLGIEPEGFLRGLRDALGFRDVQFESDEFNRAFKVKCDDERFASAFVDPGMMAFLLDTANGVRFEVNGPWLLCAVRRLDPDEVGGLIDYSLSFQAQIPAVVSDLYPNGEPR